MALQRNFFPSQIIEGSGIAIVLNADGTVSVSTDLTTDDLPTISISTVDGLQSILDDKADVSHTLADHADINISNPEVGSFLRYTQATFGADKWEAKFLTASDIPSLPISKITGLQTALDGKASSSHALLSHSDVYLVNPDPVAGQLPIYQAATGGMFGQPAGYYLRTLTASDIPSLPISKITDLQSSLDAKLTAREIRLSLLGEGETIDTTDAPTDTPVAAAGTVASIYAVADASGDAVVTISRVRSGTPATIAAVTFDDSQTATISSLTNTGLQAGDYLRAEIDSGASGIRDINLTIGVTA